jgi:hypothetical protein
MASSTVSPGHDARQVAALLALPEIHQLITDLDRLRWTGRPGNGSRVLVGAMLVKAVYALPTTTRTARLIAEHDALREVIGGAPSQWALYRFAAKLREHGDHLAGECAPKSVWVKASRLHPLVPRETDRFRQLYSQRGAVERRFGILKHEWALLPIRVRRLPRVQLHVDLTILTILAAAAVKA